MTTIKPPDIINNELLVLAGNLAGMAQNPMSYHATPHAPVPPPVPFPKPELLTEIAKALSVLCHCEVERRKSKIGNIEEYMKGVIAEVMKS